MDPPAASALRARPGFATDRPVKQSAAVCLVAAVMGVAFSLWWHPTGLSDVPLLAFASVAGLGIFPTAAATLLVKVGDTVAAEQTILELEQEKAVASIRTPYAGTVTLRRLNRREWKNTIRDLFGLDVLAPDLFPADEAGGAGEEECGAPSVVDGDGGNDGRSEKRADADGGKNESDGAGALRALEPFGSGADGRGVITTFADAEDGSAEGE